VCHHVGGAAGQPGRLEVTDRPGQQLPLGAAEGQDRGAAAGGVVDRSGHWMPGERPDVIIEQALMLERMANA
jgi:hypothetical protein